MSGFDFGGGGGGGGNDTLCTGDSDGPVVGSTKLALGLILIFGVCFMLAVAETGVWTSLLGVSTAEWLELESLSFSGGIVRVIRLGPVAAVADLVDEREEAC